jgi:hypothetical protein
MGSRPGTDQKVSEPPDVSFANIDIIIDMATAGVPIPGL